MYFLSEDPKHKLLEKIRTWGGYFIFLLTTAVAGTLVILHYNGYSFTKSGEVTRTGFVTVTSNPVKADVYLDGQKLKGTTYMRLDLPVGSHDFVVRAQGYKEWSRRLTIEPSSIYWLDYVQLYPKELKPYALQTMAKSNFKLVDEVFGKNYYFTANWEGSEINLGLLDLNNRSSNNIKNYTFTPKLMGIGENEIVEDIQIGEWNKQYSSVLLKVKTNTQQYYLYYDIEKPESIINVSKDYGLNSEVFHFTHSNKMELFYVDSESYLRIVNLDSDIITKPLIKSTDVQSYLVKNQDAVYFVKDGGLFIKKYDTNEPLKIADLPPLENRRLEFNNYDSEDYLVDYGQTSGKSVVNIWKLANDKITSAYSTSLEGNINNYRLSKDGRTVLISSDKNEVNTFVFDDKIGGSFTLGADAKEIKWGGIFQVSYKDGAGFHLIDFTGDNDVLILQDSTQYPIIVNSNFDNIFYLKDKEPQDTKPEIILNAIDMRVKN
jgi:hypothetical protein